ncbi:MAG: fructosamine kinase family protein [Gammaproteobacteria bacterium]|nr:fructosamine kinase family protein [Gammaproteobacteria bacterium]
MPWQHIARHLREATGRPVEIQSHHALGGGCINEVYRVRSTEREFFIKFNHATKVNMFTAEAAGLQTLAQTKAVRVPQPIAHGTTGQRAYLILEYIDLGGQGDRNANIRLGEQLAKLHSHREQCYGWHTDNTLGTTPQPNHWGTDWVVFWREQRLRHQVQLAQHNGIGSRVLRKAESLQEALPALFSDYTPAASVLHGDLWGGNWGVSAAGEPVIFDPAVYFGDRESDLAMTELFGGFSADFYTAYRATWPLDPGYSVRKTLYNLYHVLNHYNLFGGGYATQAEAMIDQVLAEMR